MQLLRDFVGIVVFEIFVELATLVAMLVYDGCLYDLGLGRLTQRILLIACIILIVLRYLLAIIVVICLIRLAVFIGGDNVWY